MYIYIDIYIYITWGTQKGGTYCAACSNLKMMSPLRQLTQTLFKLGATALGNQYIKHQLHTHTHNVKSELIKGALSDLRQTNLLVFVVSSTGCRARVLE